MEEIPAQSETPHDVSHTRSRTSVVWNERQHTSAQRLSSDEHNCYCDTQWLPAKMYLSFCIRVTVWEQNKKIKKKKPLPFNTLEIDSSKTAHYQDSHDHLKHVKLWSALQLNEIECLYFCLYSWCCFCCRCCTSRRQRTDTTMKVNSDRAQIQIG